MILVTFGFVCLRTVARALPDGSVELGCRVLTFDNPPSEPPHLASDVTNWGTARLSFE